MRLRAATVAVASPIMDANGALISDKQRWQQHFDLLLNRPQAVPSVELQQAASVAVEDTDISCEAPTGAVHKVRHTRGGGGPRRCDSL